LINLSPIFFPFFYLPSENFRRQVIIRGTSDVLTVRFFLPTLADRGIDPRDVGGQGGRYGGGGGGGDDDDDGARWGSRLPRW